MIITTLLLPLGHNPFSDFLRQFMDHFHLQPHHIGANAMMTLAAFTALCEAYLGIWPNAELF
jgi:hypothetical protein